MLGLHCTNAGSRSDWVGWILEPLQGGSLFPTLGKRGRIFKPCRLSFTEVCDLPSVRSFNTWEDVETSILSPCQFHSRPALPGLSSKFAPFRRPFPTLIRTHHVGRCREKDRVAGRKLPVGNGRRDAGRPGCLDPRLEFIARWKGQPKPKLGVCVRPSLSKKESATSLQDFVDA
ncbi:hypothetical protein VTK26DRAFT_4535 [Humicola hyalothermophila]